MKGPFSMTGGLKPRRSVFDLSFTKYLTCDMGQLIPVLAEECVPGDIWKIGNDIVIRAQPLVAPMFHEVNVYVHYFFVPNRLLWEDWEDFITGGKDGDYTGTPPLYSGLQSQFDFSKGSLWDYLGFPLLPTGLPPPDVVPNAFPQRAYNMIWNEFYRDENHMSEVLETNGKILNRCWKKDYFTSALPWQQRGIAPALPITGTTNAQWADALFDPNGSTPAGSTTSVQVSPTPGNARLFASGANQAANLKGMFNSNVVDFSDAGTFDVSDLRLAFQMQKFMERSARGGYRYIESLQAHYGVSPRDERLQRPEYIGGTKAPFIVSEVLQTSATDATSPQGNQAGHGMVVNRNFAGKYMCYEHGWIIGLMSVMPKNAYNSQGVNRQHLRRSRYDYYFPEFANLSEQAVMEGEICATDNGSINVATFGYQGRYDEMRFKPDVVVSEMRDTFDYWHLARKFDTANPPHLNADFLECKPAETKRIFAVQDEPGLMVVVGNKLTAIRPIPIMSEPGLIDHS